MKICSEKCRNKIQCEYLFRVRDLMTEVFPSSRLCILFFSGTLCLLIILLSLIAFVMMFSNIGFHDVNKLIYIDLSLINPDVNDAKLLQFNDQMRSLSLISSRYIAILLFFSLILVACVMVSFYIELLSVFLISWLLSIGLGLLIIKFGTTLSSDVIVNAGIIFDKVQEDYNPRYDCYSDIDKYSTCIGTPESWTNYSGMLALSYRRWQCCGFYNASVFLVPGYKDTIPVFCCEFQADHPQFGCNTITFNGLCYKLLHRLLTQSHPYMAYKAIVTMVGVFWLVFFFVTLIDAVFTYTIEFAPVDEDLED